MSTNLKRQKGDLLHGATEPSRGNAGDDLLPEKSADTQEDAPRPLLYVQRHRRKEETPKLNDENLEKVTIQIRGDIDLQTVTWETKVANQMT